MERGIHLEISSGGPITGDDGGVFLVFKLNIRFEGTLQFLLQLVFNIKRGLVLALESSNSESPFGDFEGL